MLQRMILLALMQRLLPGRHYRAAKKLQHLKNDEIEQQLLTLWNVLR